MKNLPLSIFAIITTLIFSSCSQEETTFLEEPSSELFGKVMLSRNASGAYTLNLETNNNVASSITNDDKANSLDIDLYSETGAVKESISESMSTGSEESFFVNLKNTITDRTFKVKVSDKDIKFSRTELNEQDDHLNSYSIIDNGDNTFDLNFSVDALIDVDFTQDEDTGEYLIHLEPGEGSQTDYSMTFERQEGQTTDIAFVNYYPSESGRVNTTTSTNRRRRPEVSVSESD
jgi:hypothetical protein